MTYQGSSHWYDWLVEQSRTDHIYDLIHNNLPHDFEPNHDGPFVVLRKKSLHPVLAELPDMHRVKTKSKFKHRDYLILHNDSLVEYLELATAMQEITDTEGNVYIELLFSWNSEKNSWYNQTEEKPLKHVEKGILPEELIEEEDPLMLCWHLISKAENYSLALEYARKGEKVLDKKLKALSAEDIAGILHLQTGYNIVATAYIWNDVLPDAICADAHYIHNPMLWEHMEAVIKPYLELLIAKKQQAYLGYLFSDEKFRYYFLPHYEAYMAMLVSDKFEWTQGNEVIGIITKISNRLKGYL